MREDRVAHLGVKVLRSLDDHQVGREVHPPSQGRRAHQHLDLASHVELLHDLPAEEKEMKKKI